MVVIVHNKFLHYFRLVLNSYSKIISYFQMNFQQHRNFASQTQLPQFNQPFNLPQNFTSNHSSQMYFEREHSNRTNVVKPPFNLKDYTFEHKQFYRPTPTIPNAPLTFNLQSPTKSKVKKTNRPSSKHAHKSFVNPFTKQLQDQFFKNEPNQLKPSLDDFSKTTSTINGQTILNQQQSYTEPSQQRNYTSLKPYQEPQSFTAIQHSNSLKILFERKEVQNKHYPSPNQLYHNHSSNLLHQGENPAIRTRQAPFFQDQRSLIEDINRQKQLIESYQKEIMKLNQDIRNMKEGQVKERDLRGSRQENTVEKKQLQFQIEQNNKLLAQIQAMENDIKGKQELNRYLQHQCNSYNEKYEKIRQQFEDYRIGQQQQSKKQEEYANELKKKVAELQNQTNLLKKNFQLQRDKIQLLSADNVIDKSQINVLTKKLENFQIKYEKLMHNHCQTELKRRELEQTIQNQRKKWQQTMIQFQKDQKEMEEQKNKIVEEKQDLYMQLTASKGELIKASNQREEMRGYYQKQYQSLRTRLNDSCRQIISKTQQNESMKKTIQDYEKQIQQLYQSLKISNEKKQELSCKVEESVKLAKKLSEKETQCLELSEKKNILELDYSKVSEMHLSTASMIENYASQIQEMKQSAARIQLQNSQMSKRYQAIKSNFEIQSARYKQLQGQLIQNEFDYNILQKEFSEFSLKCRYIQEENNSLKIRNKGLQEQLKEVQSKRRSQIERLQQINKQLSEKYAQIVEDYSRQKANIQRKYRQSQLNINEFSATNDVLAQKCKQFENELKVKQKECNELMKKHQQLEEAHASLQQKYSQTIQKAQQSQKFRQTELAHSKQRFKLIQDSFSKKQIEVEELQSKISKLEDTLQSLKSKDNKNESPSTQSHLQEEISSLLLIIEENQKRYQNESKQLIDKIDELSKKIQSLEQNNEEENANNKMTIESLKEMVLKLSKQIQNPFEAEPQITKQPSIVQEKCALEMRIKQWNSFTQLNSEKSSDSLSLKKFQSAQFFEEDQVRYIEMDREGVNYLCDLFGIELSSGNILNQIVVKVENNLNEIGLFRKTVESYRKVLDAFGIQESPKSYDSLISEITAFKENMSLVIEQLKQEQTNNQALKVDNKNLHILNQAEQLKNGRLLHQLHASNTLNHDLNEIIMNFTAKMCNQKFIMMETMTLARVNYSDTSICSDKYVTVKSMSQEEENKEFECQDEI